MPMAIMKEEPSAMGQDRKTAWENWGWWPRAAYEFTLKNKMGQIGKMFLEAFLASLMPDENPSYALYPTAIIRSLTLSAWRHSLTELGPSGR